MATRPVGCDGKHLANAVLDILDVSGMFCHEDNDNANKEPLQAPKILEVAELDPLDVSVLTEDVHTDRSIDYVDAPLFETPTKQSLRALDPKTHPKTPETLPTTMTNSLDGPFDERPATPLPPSPSSHPTRFLEFRVDDFSAPNFERLLYALSRNPSNLTHVTVVRLREGSNRRTRSVEDMCTFLGYIRNLPRLSTLVLVNFTMADSPILQRLLQSHPTVETVHLHFMCHTIDAALLHVLAEMPRLETLSLNVPTSFPLGIVMQSSTLTSLHVKSETFQFDRQHWLGAMDVLKDQSTLTSLDLEPKLASWGMQALGKALESNQKLKTLRFSYLEPASSAGTTLLEWSQSLAANSTLITARNHYASLLKVADQDAACISQRLQQGCRGREGGVALETLELFALPEDDIVDGTADVPTTERGTEASPSSGEQPWLLCGFNVAYEDAVQSLLVSSPASPSTNDGDAWNPYDQLQALARKSWNV
eukprot:Nitzschia sp. Nitz4//scaffold145_size56662//37264//38790//NITZ4_006562-RA/size56662-snap-gene-0.87-mRNA-1//1//CDS//3329536592//7906//frame0